MLSIIDNNMNKAIELVTDSLIILQSGSWDLYWQLANEDLKVEFIEEAIYIHSPANLDHERIFRYLLSETSLYLKGNSSGEVLGSRFPIKLKDGKRVEPDIVFLSNKDIENGELTKTFFNGKPSWIIEIVSPSYRNHDTVTKLTKYQELGVREYWIIDPEIQEIRKIIFENYKIISDTIMVDGIIKPDIDEFIDFGINISDLWKLMVKYRTM